MAEIRRESDFFNEQIANICCTLVSEYGVDNDERVSPKKAEERYAVVVLSANNFAR